MPSSLQAADYSVTMNYLKAVQAAGSTDGDQAFTSLADSQCALLKK